MKRYRFELTLEEQSDEFWEEITKDGNSGCDKLQDFIKTELESFGFELDIRLKSFEDSEY